MNDDRPPFFTKPELFLGVQKKTLFLDMDETLVHCFVTRPSFFNPEDECFLEFTLPDDPSITYYAFKRPGVDEFIQRCMDHYEVRIFTAADADYAKVVLRWLAPHIPETLWYFRDSCVGDMDSGFMKDLSRLEGFAFDPASTLLLDDSAPANTFPATNAIAISRFAPKAGQDEIDAYHKMRSDIAMMRFGDMLCKDSFAKSTDVRTPIREFYNLMNASMRRLTGG